MNFTVRLDNLSIHQSPAPIRTPAFHILTASMRLKNTYNPFNYLTQ